MSEAEQPTGRALRHQFDGPFWRHVLIESLRRMPYPVQTVTMPFWAGLFYTLVPKARRAVEANLDRVMGYASPAVRHLRSYRLFINYAQSVANHYCLHLGRPFPVEPAFDGIERARLLAILGRGKGAILCTGHMGYWALGPFVMERFGVGAPIIAMAEEPNARVQEFEQQVRKRWRIVYTTDSPFASLELAGALRRGEMIAMQFDRATGDVSIRLPFFGREALFPVGPAMLGRVTQAPLVPVFMVREGSKGFRVFLEEPITVPHTSDRDRDVREATARLVSVYEGYVRRYPEQWFNFHDFWATPVPEPEGERER